MNAIEYIKTKERLLYTPYIRRDGKGYRLYKGVEIPEADFQQATAMPQRPYICASNPCRKHQYLNVEGSVLDNLEKLVRCAQ